MKRGNQKQFQLAKQMHDAGVKNKVIAEVIKKSPVTIGAWLVHEKWADYQKYNTEKGARLKAARLARQVVDEVVSEPTQLDISPSEAPSIAPEQADPISEVIARLDRIENMLKAKRIVW